MEPQPGMKAGSRVIHASARIVNMMRTDTSANLADNPLDTARDRWTPWTGWSTRSAR